MQTGTVGFFHAEKGFGFITPHNGATDIFVHHTDIQMEGYRFLEKGQQVSFEIAPSPKGPRAVNVEVI